MHPAFSIIVFTTFSGLGYGLAAMLGLGLLDASAISTKIAHVLALALAAGGLTSSLLHLGNPKRAWRALSQWRTSWLSREGVMAILTFIPLVASAWVAIFDDRYLVVFGLLGTVFCGVTVYCTAMIYASLRSVGAWNTQLTPLCYLLFSGAGGAILASFFAFSGGGWPLPPLLLALIFLGAAWFAKVKWRERMTSLVPLSTPESATGLGNIGKVRLLERPHINENYLTSEMGFKIARKHAVKLWRIAIALGGVVPAIILAALLIFGAQGWASGLFAALAVLCHLAGVMVERWLFFAEARHAVMNYY